MEPVGTAVKRIVRSNLFGYRGLGWLGCVNYVKVYDAAHGEHDRWAASRSRCLCEDERRDSVPPGDFDSDSYHKR